MPAKMPIALQFHGNPVRFRNIWIREMKDIHSTARHAASSGLSAIPFNGATVLARLTAWRLDAYARCAV